MSEKDSNSLTRNMIALKALEMLQAMSWADLEMMTLAQRLNVQGSQLYECTSDKNDLLKSIIQLIDDMTVESYQTNIQGSQDLLPLDQLFEGIMCRLEVIFPYKKAFENLKGVFLSGSLCHFEILPQIFISSEKMLKMASISTKGILGMIKVKAFAIVYIIILKDWLKEEKTDPSDMMIEIDRLLKQIALLLNRD